MALVPITVQCPELILWLLLPDFSTGLGKGVATSGILHFRGFQGAVLPELSFTLGCAPLTPDPLLHLLATYILPRCSQLHMLHM